MKCWKLITPLLVLILLLMACTGADRPAAPETQRTAEGDVLPKPDTPEAGSESLPAQDSAGSTEAASPVPTPDTAPVSSAPEETTPSAPRPEVSEAFAKLFPDCPDSVTAVVLNETFPNGMLDASISWNQGEYDRLCLVPRYVGSVVAAYRLTADESGALHREEVPVYSGTAENGAVYSAALERPEGFPAWYLEVTTPDGSSSGLTLEYNGRTGTPPVEFLNVFSEEQAEFIQTIASENIVPLSLDDLNAYAQAAAAEGLSPWEAADRYFSQLNDIGDGAAFTKSEGHEMVGNVYRFRMARIHQNYLVEAYGIDEIVTGQYSIYDQLGNTFGILGPEAGDVHPDLVWHLTGLTVFNRLLAAREIRVTVDGEDFGTFSLPADQVVTLIPIDQPDRIADHPIDVEITVVSTWYGEASDAWIDVFGGIQSNISSAL